MIDVEKEEGTEIIRARKIYPERKAGIIFLALYISFILAAVFVFNIPTEALPFFAICAIAILILLFYKYVMSPRPDHSNSRYVEELERNGKTWALLNAEGFSSNDLFEMSVDEGLFERFSGNIYSHELAVPYGRHRISFCCNANSVFKDVEISEGMRIILEMNDERTLMGIKIDSMSKEEVEDHLRSLKTLKSILVILVLMLTSCYLLAFILTILDIRIF